MKCNICDKSANKNSIVCSDECNDIRLLIISMSFEYVPTNGCDNCWGDLRQGCTLKCREESKRAAKFTRQLRSLIKFNPQSKG